MTTDCIIFDCDGTLFDTGEGIRDCAVKSLAAVGAPPIDESKLNAFIGPSLFHSFTVTVGLSEELSLKAIEYYRQFYGEEGLFKSHPYPGIERMLTELSGDGCKLAVASSKPLIMLNRLLTHYGFDRYFDIVSAPDYSKRGSEKRELILSACAGSRNVMVGDTHYDIDGAHEAGIKAIGVTYGYGARSDIASADYLADSPEQITELIRSGKVF